MAFKNEEFIADLESVRNVVKTNSCGNVIKIKVSCENVLEKFKFVAFIAKFNNFSASYFIWKNFFAFF